MLGRYSVLARFLVLLFLILSAVPAGASAAPALPGGAGFGRLASAVVFSQPPNPNGGIILSSKRVPDGSDTDQYAWDNFQFAAPQSITEVRWRGLYDPNRNGSGKPVVDFVVDIYASTASGTQPNINAGPLVHYTVGGNAGETPSAVIADVQTYDYAFVLPTPFQAAGGSKYWLHVEAHQSGAPDWGLAAGINGDGVYFRRIPGAGENYQLYPGDTSFSLLAPSANGAKIFLPVILTAGR